MGIFLNENKSWNWSKLWYLVLGISTCLQKSRINGKIGFLAFFLSILNIPTVDQQKGIYNVTLCRAFKFTISKYIVIIWIPKNEYINAIVSWLSQSFWTYSHLPVICKHKMTQIKRVCRYFGGNFWWNKMPTIWQRNCPRYGDIPVVPFVCADLWLCLLVFFWI